MPLRKNNTRTFMKHLFGGQLEEVVLKKRDDDQRQGVVRSIALFSCRWSVIYKTGEPLHGDMSSNHSRVLHVPRIELDRVGVNYLNAIDRFVDVEGRHWQPESGQLLSSKLFENHIDIQCLRCDPPGGPHKE